MKPKWEDAPEWAQWLFWDKYPESWIWCSQKPTWNWFHQKLDARGAWVYSQFGIKWAGNGKDSMEPRP